MAIGIDLIIIAIMALCIFFGYKRGLIGVIFKFLSFIVAIVIAVFLYKPVAGYLVEHTNWDESLEAVIAQNIEGKKEESSDKEQQQSEDVLTMYINQAIEQTADSARQGIATAVSHNLAVSILYGATFLVLFVIGQLLLLFGRAISDMLAELPIIKQFNKAGGTVYGILEGIIVIYVIFMILSLISPMVEGTGIVEAINQSYIGKYLYYHNILLKMIF